LLCFCPALWALAAFFSALAVLAIAQFFCADFAIAAIWGFNYFFAFRAFKQGQFNLNFLRKVIL